MFERLTASARQVIVVARQEARALNHEQVGTGRILLGLLRADASIAMRVLTSLGADCERIRADLVRMLSAPPLAPGRSEAAVGSGTDLPHLDELSDRELKRHIQQLTEREQAVSHERRVLHAKIDLLRAELVARLRRRRRR